MNPQEIARLVARPDPVILDIGCNDGEHTKMFLDLFPQGRVFSFDPEPRVEPRFHQNVCDGRATFFPLAIGSKDGITSFYQSSGLPPGGHARPWDLSGSIRKPTGHLLMHPWCMFEERTSVNVARLDSLRIVENERIDFIWADVQGAERDLIEGARETLRRTRYFYTEYSDVELYEGQPRLSQIEALLPGFVVHQIFQFDVLFRNEELS